MVRKLWALVVLLFVWVPSLGGPLEKAIKSRWLGAWVVMDVETYSDCSGRATNNRVNGSFVKSSGNHRFQPGELAKVNKVAAKRSRFDLHLILPESILVPRQAGPFTLYDEAHCKVELEIMLPRDFLKTADVDSIDNALDGILERFRTEEDARDSASWNGRAREDYPEDYERTLAQYAAWQAEQTNIAVQAKLGHARQATERFPDRFSSDESYVAGMVKGMEQAKARELNTCDQLMAVKLEPAAKTRSSRQAATEEQKRYDRGYQDGRRLLYGLEMVRRLPSCFVPVPEVPELADGAAADSPELARRGG